MAKKRKTAKAQPPTKPAQNIKTRSLRVEGLPRLPGKSSFDVWLDNGKVWMWSNATQGHKDGDEPGERRKLQEYLRRTIEKHYGKLSGLGFRRDGSTFEELSIADFHTTGQDRLACLWILTAEDRAPEDLKALKEVLEKDEQAKSFFVAEQDLNEIQKKELLAFAKGEIARASPTFSQSQVGVGIPASTTVAAETVHYQLNSAKNVLLQGVPGVGKSYLIEDLCKTTYGGRSTRIVMHGSVGYEDMLEGVRPSAGASEHESAIEVLASDAHWFDSVRKPTKVPIPPFIVRAGAFLIACAKAARDSSNSHLVVLEELNRCSIPMAFGELLYLVEASKRARYDSKTMTWEGPTARLPLSGLDFFVPDNLHIIATMNTADRSTIDLDQAFLRRFYPIRLQPMDADRLKDLMTDEGLKDSVEQWKELNKQLRTRIGPDAVLGHSYFFDAANQTEPTVSLWRHGLLPQLAEILTTARLRDSSLLDDLNRCIPKAAACELAPTASGPLQRVCIVDR